MRKLKAFIHVVKMLIKYRAADKKVQEINTTLDDLFKAEEFVKRINIIAQWSNACVKRNKLEKKLLKAILDI